MRALAALGVLAAVVALAACGEDRGSAGSETVQAAPAPEPEPVAQIHPAKGQATPTDCGAHETPIFSCLVQGGKRLAICADGRGARYRFGPENAAEITIEGGRWAHTAYSGGGEAQIAFARGDTRYIVFSRMIRTNFEAGEPNQPAISDGVLVQRGGTVISVRRCEGAETLPVQYDAAETHLERADDLFTDQTIRADPS